MPLQCYKAPPGPRLTVVKQGLIGSKHTLSSSKPSHSRGTYSTPHLSFMGSVIRSACLIPERLSQPCSQSMQRKQWTAYSDLSPTYNWWHFRNLYLILSLNRFCGLFLFPAPHFSDASQQERRQALGTTQFFWNMIWYKRCVCSSSLCRLNCAHRVCPAGTHCQEFLVVTAQEKQWLLPRNNWRKMILQHGLKLDSCNCPGGVLHIKE